jgi:hypothetical protein
MTDARFEDAGDGPVRLLAEDADDLPVIAALLQDAVLSGADIRYDRGRRELALLLNRFRWEDQAAAEARKRPYERVRTVLLLRDVLSVASQGFDRTDADLVLSVLDLGFLPGEDGAGDLLVTLSGDGAIRARVECLNLTVTDVSRPYIAPSGKRPTHPE